MATMVAMVGLLLMGGLAMANGVPVRLFLNYLPETSNWGPQTASGSALVGVGDGFVQLSVNGLPHLSIERYAVWLVPRDEGAWVPIGTFNVDESGAGDFGWVPDVFPYQEYRFIVVTVEPHPDQDNQPDPRISLVGTFPNPAAVLPSAAAPTSPSSSPQTQDQDRPQELPVTGSNLSTQARWPTSLAYILTVTLGVLLGVGGWQMVQRRREQ